MNIFVTVAYRKTAGAEAGATHFLSAYAVSRFPTASSSERDVNPRLAVAPDGPLAGVQAEARSGSRARQNAFATSGVAG